MALTPGKCNFIFLGLNISVSEVSICENFKLNNTAVNEILRATIDMKHKLDNHVKHVCKKAGKKL